MKKYVSNISILLIVVLSSCNVFKSRDVSDIEKGMVNITYLKPVVLKKKLVYEQREIKNFCSVNLIPAFLYQFKVKNDKCIEIKMPRLSSISADIKKKKGDILLSCYGYCEKTVIKNLVCEKKWEDVNTTELKKIYSKLYPEVVIDSSETIVIAMLDLVIKFK